MVVTKNLCGDGPGHNSAGLALRIDPQRRRLSLVAQAGLKDVRTFLDKSCQVLATHSKMWKSGHIQCQDLSIYPCCRRQAAE